MTAIAGVIAGLKRRSSVPRAVAIRRALPLYIGAIAVAELAGALGAGLLGAVLYALIVVALIEHCLRVVDVWGGDRPAAIAADEAALVALMLVAVTRVLALGLPAADLAAHPAAVVGAIPLLLVPLLGARLVGLQSLVNLRPQARLHAEASMACAGITLGLAAAIAFDLQPLVPDPSPAALAAAAIGVFLVGGVAEEVIFRGVLQRALTRVYGLYGVPLAAGLFALGYLGAGSAGLAALVSIVGLVYGIHAWFYGSIAGVAVSHGLFAAGAIVIWPLVV